MKLATRLVALFMLFVLPLIAVNGWLSMREEARAFERAESHDLTQLGTTLQEFVFEGHDLVRILELVHELSDEPHEMKCRWVWFSGDDAATNVPRITVSVDELMAADHNILRPVDAGDDRLAYVYVQLNDPRTGGLEVETDAETFHALRRSEIIQGMRSALLIMFSGVFAVFFGDRLVARPLNVLMEKTRRVGRGDLMDPVVVPGRTELAELGTAINKMCDDLETSRAEAAAEHARRIEAMEQLRHTDRLRTAGQLAAGIAHEIGTPLNVVSGRAGMIAGGRLSEEQIGESARIIRSQVDHISIIVRQLLDFARPAPPERRRVDLRTAMQETVELLLPMARKSGATIDLDLGDEPMPASVDFSQVQQVLTNLVMNAIHAMPDGGPVKVRLGHVTGRPPDDPDATPRRCIHIDVEDRGAGIAPDVLPNVFEPFFTTKGIGEGTGMGLSVAYGIVREHDGWIDVRSEVGRGTCFSVVVPEVDE